MMPVFGSSNRNNAAVRLVEEAKFRASFRLAHQRRRWLLGRLLGWLLSRHERIEKGWYRHVDVGFGCPLLGVAVVTPYVLARDEINLGFLRQQLHTVEASRGALGLVVIADERLCPGAAAVGRHDVN